MEFIPFDNLPNIAHFVHLVIPSNRVIVREGGLLNGSVLNERFCVSWITF